MVSVSSIQKNFQVQAVYHFRKHRLEGIVHIFALLPREDCCLSHICTVNKMLQRFSLAWHKHWKQGETASLANQSVKTTICSFMGVMCQTPSAMNFWHLCWLKLKMKQKRYNKII